MKIRELDWDFKKFQTIKELANAFEDRIFDLKFDLLTEFANVFSFVCGFSVENLICESKHYRDAEIKLFVNEIFIYTGTFFGIELWRDETIYDSRFMISFFNGDYIKVNINFLGD